MQIKVNLIHIQAPLRLINGMNYCFKKVCGAVYEFQFNSVLLNEYPNGKVGMGWHSDDEKKNRSIIASLSFGANRDFIFKHKTDKSVDNITIHLKVFLTSNG